MNRKSTLRNNTAIGLMDGAIVADESNRSPSDRIHFMLRGYSQMPSTHSDGIPASPTPAPTIPPTIAAVVSASPPHSMMAVTACRKSSGWDNQA